MLFHEYSRYLLKRGNRVILNNSVYKSSEYKNIHTETN